jgi:hypothetical protein
MGKRQIFIIGGLFIFFSGCLFSQEHWFKAQSEKAVVDSIISTSELVEGQYGGKYLYPPINMLDGNFDTTWCEADEGGSGIGESITLALSEPLSFNEIQLVNGFSSGSDYYHKNNRVAKITLTQTAGEHFQQKQYTLQDDQEGWQSIRFDLTQTAQTVNFRIDEVYKGYKYDDTCFSDIRFLMDGRVIPFENVDKIRAVQEENSKAMLNSEKGVFLQQIRKMAGKFGSKTTLFLLEERGLEGYVLQLDPNADFSQSSIECKMFPFELYNIKENSFDWDRLEHGVDASDASGTLPSPRNKSELETLMGNRELFIYKPADYNNSSHRITDYKLITRENIDYVVTETIKLLKLDGDKGIYINGEYYALLDEDNKVVLREYY